MVGAEYQKWITKLMGYQFYIHYWTGASNRVAGALSRIPDQIECAVLTVPQWPHWDVLKHELEQDEFLRRIRDDITSGNQHQVGFTVEQGLLYNKGRLVIPKTSQLISTIIGEFHNSPMGGSFGRGKDLSTPCC